MFLKLSSDREFFIRSVLRMSLKIITVLVIFSRGAASADEEAVYKITVKDHRFSPVELRVPVNKKVKILVENQDATPEEFESYDLNREKIITANGKAVLYVGPLKPGTYQYCGEFHQETAQGKIIALADGEGN